MSVRFDPIMAEMRFGCGLSPHVPAPESVSAMLQGLQAEDAAARAHPIEDFDRYLDRVAGLHDLRRRIKDQGGADMAALLQKETRAYRQGMRRDWRGWVVQSLLRRSTTEDGFRERLAFFWGDHFTAKGKTPALRSAATPYVESAIRPHVAGRFEDMLIAAATHPLMLNFLDQQTSIGPNSPFARKRPEKKLGLNENLAREILELHTLGVGGPYDQNDVQQLAELLTGLSWSADKGVLYRQQVAEPGAERVLGKWYGTQQGALGDVHAVLVDLARHPATARHLAHKLAVHFVSDTPDPAMVAEMTRAYLDTKGALPAVYRAMLDHPAAWQEQGTMKQPIAFVASALRAQGLTRQDAQDWSDKEINARILVPLALMGQSWEEAAGPDGWSEDDAQWAAPQGLAARLQWALQLPEILPRKTPDPRDFVHHALGPRPPEQVLFAARAAESRREGIALVLMSPAFQRH